jgi:uncharacterized protein
MPVDTQQAPGFVPRIEGLDALRGFALFGIFIVHMPELFELYWAHPATDPTQLAWHDTVFTIFAGKSFALLALCFGVSFFIIMDRAAQKGRDFTGRFIWRLAVLGAIGLLHGLWYRGDILDVLAVMGLFLLPFYRVKSNPLILAVGGFFLLQPLMIVQLVSALHGAEWANRPFYYWSDKTPDAYLTGKSLIETIRVNWVDGHPFKWAYMYESGRLSEILGLSLIGLVLGRIGFFAKPEKFNKTRLLGFVVALAAALLLWHFQGALAQLMPASATMVMPRALWKSMISSWFDLSLMFTLMFGFTTLYYGAAGKALHLLAPAGRMTLTLYLLQSLVFVPVYYSFGLGLHATITQSQAVLLGILVFAVQVVLANLWFRAFYYGPVEWLWRAATYLTVRVPFVRKRPVVMASA